MKKLLYYGGAAVVVTVAVLVALAVNSDDTKPKPGGYSSPNYNYSR